MKPSRAADLPYRACVGMAVFNAAGKVWAGRRISKGNRGETSGPFRWQLPQGGIDKDEDPLKAAYRELYEETGIRSVSLIAEVSGWLKYDLPEELLGRALKGKYCGQTQKWFAFRFEGEESEINIENPPDGSDPEFDAWEWKDLAAMPALIIPFKRSIYERLVSEFSDL